MGTCFASKLSKFDMNLPVLLKFGIKIQSATSSTRFENGDLNSRNKISYTFFT